MQERTLSFHFTVLDRVAILGASRGLGFALYQEFKSRYPQMAFFLSSRKINDRASEVSDNTALHPQDFSKLPVDETFESDLRKFLPTHLIYCAGGGPYGNFETKKWSDHQWALQTSLLYPAELLHRILSRSEAWSGLRQIVFVGSEIAETKPDPRAASYAAAKHGLRGLISTIKIEQDSMATEINKVSRPEIMLFSPGYMQTDLLPADSWPIQKGLAEQPSVVAKKLIAAIEKNNQR